MLNPGINIRRSKTTILFIWIFLFFSCVETLTESENDIIEISKTTIELDRYNNELFIQIETNQHETQEVIQEVLLELTYIGGNTYEYSEIFQLFDLNLELSSLLSLGNQLTLQRERFLKYSYCLSEMDFGN